jgi:hypothetical protein
MLQISEAAMDQPCRTTGSACPKIVLLDKKDSLSSLCTLPRDSNPIDAATDNNYIESLAVEPCVRIGAEVHWQIRCVRNSFISSRKEACEK